MTKEEKEILKYFKKVYMYFGNDFKSWNRTGDSSWLISTEKDFEKYLYNWVIISENNKWMDHVTDKFLPKFFEDLEKLDDE